MSGFGRFVRFRVFSREYPVKTHEVKGLWKRRVWEYEKDGAQSVKKPLLIIIKGHYNDKFLWLTLPEIDYLCDQWNRPPDQKQINQPNCNLTAEWGTAPPYPKGYARHSFSQ